MKFSASVVASAGFIATASAHGFISSPEARMPGPAMQTKCGAQVFNNQNSDNFGNVQGEKQVAVNQADFNEAECNLWLCKGYQFDDNKANVQEYTAGEEVQIKVDIRAPHSGVANVSVVDTETNSVIGEPLVSFDEYASNSSPITTKETDLSVKIPDNLGDKCSTAGACVIQWTWDARSIDQTYMACIDFTVSGGSASSSDSDTVSTPEKSSPEVEKKPTSYPAPKEDTDEEDDSTPTPNTAEKTTDSTSGKKITTVEDLITAISEILESYEGKTGTTRRMHARDLIRRVLA
ncbi:MAG: hypothetical protein M1837_003515 [Sclerophora amabilis]|nr:MAG: hypothetical protein M1837_003515 [Sclerophora amabilis]